MTKFIFIRHGQANYKPIDERNFIGHGRDLAPLSELGEGQIKKAAKDPRLRGSELIISSPYTRAMQSAAIISRELQLDLRVEVDLHEWIPDTINFQYKTTEDCLNLYKDYDSFNGIHPKNEAKVWESGANMKNRVSLVLKKYLKFNQVIVVCHGMVIGTQKNNGLIKNGEIIEIIKK